MNDREQDRIQWADALLWLAKADDDIRVADLALAADPPLPDPAAFHCQQAVEKIIKALLVAASSPPLRTHDIEALAEKAVPFYPTLEQRMFSFVRLTEWLTASRYPDLGGGLGEEISDIAKMLTEVKVFRQEVAALTPR
jgi:HEPN domain-containing protein